MFVNGKPVVFTPAGDGEVQQGPTTVTIDTWGKVFIRNVGGLQVFTVADSSPQYGKCQYTLVGPSQQAVDAVKIDNRSGHLIFTGGGSGSAVSNGMTFTCSNSGSGSSSVTYVRDGNMTVGPSSRAFSSAGFSGLRLELRVRPGTMVTTESGGCSSTSTVR